MVETEQTVPASFFLHHVFRQENCVKAAIVLCIDEEGVMMSYAENVHVTTCNDVFISSIRKKGKT